ncbi:ABC transporter permease [Quisquiliibacterium transsilvanicum]|uniref:Iron(III) transport system permease protein n=1 Tax=Quisquiliibacterium transsilvanicum TaxID=1549638 RepID=A0A7W8M7D6_9BURK|nr:iron ABC transporter permease [Quisquiliibacterium transsilvanicum]MBB5270628.1 iron(III) transport system permease protein [Quisquiliibacterium transsilvanicum]
MAAAPIVVLLWLAASPSAGWDTLAHLAATVLPSTIASTLMLAAVVLAVVLVVGVGSGWLVAAYDFPGRRWLAWALVLPLSMPAFVLAYAYTDFFDTSGPFQSWLRGITGWAVREYWFPDIRSLPGAGFVLGLALYPYVYMLARNAFAERSPSLAEAARSLGMHGRLAWWRVTWPVARPAVAAGCALVLMETLADFGTVTYFGVDTLTAAIYRSWQGLGDRVAAARLAFVLLAMVGFLVLLERRQRQRMRFYARGAKPAPRTRLEGAAGWQAFALCSLPVLLGFVLPTLLLLRAWLSAGAPTDPRMFEWVLNSVLLASIAAALILPVALVTAYAARLVRNRFVGLAVTLACAGYAMPGVVIGVGLMVWIGSIDRMLGMLLLGGTIVAVVYAYGVRFFSIAYQGMEAALARISPSMDNSARSLGLTPVEVLREVHWPLLRPSLAGAALLVVVDCLKELPATLVLRPFDFDTLAVSAYHFAADERLAEAALPSLLMVLAGLLPVLLLSRFAGRSAAGDSPGRRAIAPDPRA